MKIGILTHPLKTNYGAILQNYALQQTLISLGHQPITFDIQQGYNNYNFMKKVLEFFYKKIHNKKNKFPLLPKQENVISKYTRQFVKSHIKLTKATWRPTLQITNQEKIQALIVGSDQVWHPAGFKHIEDMYFSFCKDNKIIKLAYAASFGVDNWVYNPTQTKHCAQLIRNFKAISVRENTGINLCKKHLNIDAEKNLDPVFLLNKNEYIKLLDTKEKQKEKLVCYILDMTTEKKRIIENIAQQKELEISYIGNPLTEDYCKPYRERIAPPLEKWLEGFYNAKYVITDSFHGTAFSIIFNKTFLTIGNEHRGLARFESLLSLFNLENRLLLDENVLPEHLREINYSLIEPMMNKEQKKSIEYLKKHLKKQN